MMQRIEADKMQGMGTLSYSYLFIYLCLSSFIVPLLVTCKCLDHAINLHFIFFRFLTSHVINKSNLIISPLLQSNFYFLLVLLTGMHHDKIFRLPGAYRHLVTLAKNVRVAPVHTPKRQQRSSSEDLYGNRDKEEIKEENEIEVQGDGVSEAVYAIDPPAWMTPADYLSSTSTSTSTSSLKSVEQTSSKKKVGKGGKEGGEGGRGIEGDYPFSSQVEKMWVSDVIPRLLHDIYSTSSSALHSSNIGLLPSALTRAVDGDHHSTHADSHTTSHSNYNAHTSEAVDSSSFSSSSSSDRDEGRNEMEGLRISFSLCASTYATTFLDHLVDSLNKDVQKK